jgi:hypothetical protein
MTLNTIFRFNKCGQGGFYTGCLGLDSRKFYFCYDCGSLSNIKTAINEESVKFKKYLNSDNNGKLDMLVISHFDSDHVNFVKKLCTDIKCGRAIIPYVEPVERLRLAIKAGNIDEDYNSFLINPYKYLLDLGFEDVIVIFHNDDGNVLADDFIPPEPDDAQPSNEIPVKINLKRISEKFFDAVNEYESVFLNLRHYKNISFYSDEGYINIIYAWMFKFYAKQRPPEEKARLNYFILEILGKRQNDKILSDDILKLFDDLKTVREKYKSAFKGKDLMNSTSLLMLHRPFNNYQNIEMMMIEDNIHWITAGSLNNCCSTLLTSDSNLMNDYDELAEHFKEEIKKIAICQVPHHGSRRSWDKRIVNDLISCNIWVINYGIGNRYGHPALLVLYDLLNVRRGNKIFMTTEFTEFCYLLTLIY